ncbi:MAG: hypothetical protein KDE27_03705 [Planctomycetes bacterium]|nr:hypothetical protein [Planctomycetota bacterium]
MTTTLAALKFFAGTKRVLNMTVYDGDAGSSTPLDLTGMTVTWAIAAKSAEGVVDAAVVASKTATIVSASAGTCQVTLLSADTAELDPGDYWQEWEVTDGAGEKSVVAVGDVVLRQNIG